MTIHLSNSFSFRLTIGFVASLFFMFTTHVSAVQVSGVLPASPPQSGSQTILGISSSENGYKYALWKNSNAGNAVFVQGYDSDHQALFSSSGMFVGFDATTITSDALGNFTVLFSDNSTSTTRLYFKKYNSTGVQLGGTVYVQSGQSSQFSGEMKMNNLGEFVITWVINDSSGPRSYAKLYNTNGSVSMNTKQIATGSVTNVALCENGRFVPIWRNLNGNKMSAYFRVFSKTGSAVSSTKLVSGSYLANPTGVDMNGDCEIALSWGQYYGSSQGWKLFVRHYSPSGASLGSSTTPVNKNFVYEPSPKISLFDSGSYALIWKDSTTQKATQTFNQNGSALSNAFIYASQSLNTGETYIESDNLGEYAIAWSQQDTSSSFDAVVRFFKIEDAIDVTKMDNDDIIYGISAPTNGWRYYNIVVPKGNTYVDVTMFDGGGVGDADLYIRARNLPDDNNWDVRPYLQGSNESVRLHNVPPGNLLIGIRSFISFTDVGLHVSSQ